MIMEKVMNFPSELKNISYAEKLIDEISEKYHLTPEVYGNILVTMIEAVSNAIVHGNKMDTNALVHLGCTVDDDFIKFNVKDEGEGFDFEIIPDPTTPANIEKPHGRGIFLMNSLADEIHFYHRGAEVELKFRIR